MKTLKYIVGIISLLIIIGISFYCGMKYQQNQVLIVQSDTNQNVNSKIKGIDVSRHQGNIDWEKVKESIGDSIYFAYIKATEGGDYVDPKFKINLQGAKMANLKAGAYHFFRTTSSAEKQFDNFKKTVPKTEIDLIPVVDVEECKEWSKSKLQTELEKFISLLKKEYECNVMIYGTQRSYNSFCAPEFNSYPLMIGRYGKNEPEIKGGATYTIWQYSDTSIFPGIPKPVDMDLLREGLHLEAIIR